MKIKGEIGRLPVFRQPTDFTFSADIVRSVRRGNVVPYFVVFGQKFFREFVVPFGLYDDDGIAVVLEIDDQLVRLCEKVYRFHFGYLITALDYAEP